MGEVVQFPGAIPGAVVLADLGLAEPPTNAELALQVRELEDEWELLHRRLEEAEGALRARPVVVVGPLERTRIALSRLLDRLFAAVGL